MNWLICIFSQMSGVWDFLKRHRGKIVAGAVVAGGAFVVQQAWRNSSFQLLSYRWNRDREFSRTQLKVSKSYFMFALFILFVYFLGFCFSKFHVALLGNFLCMLKIWISDSITIQARRHYIYDTQHRTCDISILDLLPTIANRISLYFDVEALIEDLKNNKELSKEQRIIQWQDIKVPILR